MRTKAYSYLSTLRAVYAKTGDKTQAVKAADIVVSPAHGQAKVAMQRNFDAPPKLLKGVRTRGQLSGRDA
jgi:hypothetical protein